MHEIELKFQVPAARRKAVDAAVAGRNPPRRQRLQAAYVDTAGRALAGAGLALRVRREGRQWVQTLKGPADDGMTRFEHNVARGTGAEAPAADPALHAGTPAGDRLLALLAGPDDARLEVLYRTDILRRTRLVRTPHGSVELAFDEGGILAGGARLAVCELEVELRAGAPAAVIETARRWVARFGLWRDGRSKAERGDLLARGERRAPCRRARPVRLDKRMSAAGARRAVLASCADQIVANASQIASGDHDDEHVHQLRIGLRRLRSAVRFFDGLHGAAPAWNDAAAALFRGLGAARDAAVVEAQFAAELATALESAGVAAAPPVPSGRAKAFDTPDGTVASLGADARTARGATTPAAAVALAAPGGSAVPPGASAATVAGDAPTPAALLREPAAQTLLLDLLVELSTGDSDGDDGAGPRDAAEPALAARLARRLKRWHRRAAADAARFGELDADARHALRKRIKRLRYALEFSADVLPRRPLRRYLRVLRAVQERLGAINDVSVALAAFAERRHAEPPAWFALGWLVARRDALVAAADAELRALAKARPFWKRR